jgi:ABC-type glutathione transport system ATPase component
MYGSRVVESGQVRDVLSRPAHPYTLALLESVPQADLDQQHLRSIVGCRRIWRRCHWAAVSIHAVVWRLKSVVAPCRYKSKSDPDITPTVFARRKYSMATKARMTSPTAADNALFEVR